MAANDPRPDADRPSLFRGKAWFWIPILPLVVLDLWSKAAVFSMDALAGGRPHTVIDWGAVSFELCKWRNTGTIWGLFQDSNLELKILRCIALPVLVYFAWRTPARSKLQLLVLGAITSGAVGNLYDNFFEKDGAVRDFLLFSARWGGGKHEFPAFNVADSCICVGAFTLMFLLWRQDARSAKAAREPA